MAPNSQTIRHSQRNLPQRLSSSLYSDKCLPTPLYTPVFSDNKNTFTNYQKQIKTNPPFFISDNKNSSKNKKNPFDYSLPVKEMDQQLAKIRETPSKIICERKKITVFIDMSNFRAEDVQVYVEKGRLTILAEQEVKLNNSTTVIKKFSRKFVIPDDVRNEFIATELDEKGKLKITALRGN
ncbi:Alpha crystallin/Hsp20 domain and HSP20-like chaperone domain-containing protein [Strongyloides ratti]|uniref:Alpha crystallin/Hsp20 domain and HSP20-like chaperone domain-containing protein n=1 Tax=Strongyloides ratti TaxID=34506 RepID=A0A090MQ37_STRRB|nr:Alpha crystallin/Hsp20 domain and HSP20-like chaperone domain-containing protein [Strongyloides ratti]CEF60248.1 Alpha crystallin/Hsp20 domain and HSP20-like chaperone domain-containing protein [Strongyloides ratti]